MTKKTSQIKDIILLCTSDEALLHELSIMVSDNYTLIHAKGYDDALKQMTYSIPQLIIADNRDEGKGKKLLKDIRSSIKTRLIPFIIISDTASEKERVQFFNAGADAFLGSPVSFDELKALITININRYKEFYQISITDELTRLHNRKEFINNFQNHIESDPDSEITLTIIDIDFFKKVNDLYGHQTGDVVLMDFADLLKKHSSESFFPARFGGEEFVVLSPGMNSDQLKVIIDDILVDFSKREFKSNEKTFHVTFSAGIAQYPSMSGNVSELLSRADQALYAAKNAGRSRVFIFSQVMLRNDKFWEYLKGTMGTFIDTNMNNAITGLPYLPTLFETVSNLEFDVKSIGVLIIKLHPLFGVDNFFGYANKQYDIENITLLIKKSCDLIFPSDTYLGNGDIYSDEYIVLFPGVVDFSLNTDMFQKICRDINNTINYETSFYNIDLSYCSDVIFLNKSEPAKMYQDVLKIRKKDIFLTSKKKNFQHYLKLIKQLPADFNINKYLHINKYYCLDDQSAIYDYLALRDPFAQTNILSAIIIKSIKSTAKLKKFMQLVSENFTDQITSTLLVPWITSISLKTYKLLMEEYFPETKYILMINQKDLPQVFEKLTNDPLSGSVSFGIDNCFIGNDILGYLSVFNFKVLLFSENIIRNLHYFKDRITIISGLKIFLDQVNVLALAKNIQKEEEFQVIQDLKLDGASGKFMIDLVNNTYKTEKFNL